MFDASSSSTDLAMSSVSLAILPIGSIEQHGRSLPLSTDWRIADAIAREVAKRFRSAYLLPALPFSCAGIHDDFRGTVSLAQSTLDLVVKDIVRALFAQGFNRVLIVNFHGGNFVLKATVRDLNHGSEHAKVLMVWPWHTAAAELSDIIETRDEVHAGELEASLILAIEPGLVRDPTVADDFIPDVTHEHLDYRRLIDVSPTGVWGKPSLGTHEKGMRALTAMVDRVVQHADRMFQALGLTET